MILEKKYLDLLKKSLLNEIYLENELRIFSLAEKELVFDRPFGLKKLNYEKLHHIGRIFPQQLADFHEKRFEGELIKVNTPHLVYADTMIGRKRLDHLHYCLDTLRDEKISGDLIECGVWRGGASIFMKSYLDTYNMSDRAVYLADSFEGVPESVLEEDKATDLSKRAYPGLAVPLEDVKNNFSKYDVSMQNVFFIEGWFKDTLSKAPINQLALLRLDGDLYESTMDALNALYHKVVPKGFVIIDDFKALPQCEQAVHDFRQKNNINEPIQKIDNEAVYWRKIG